MSDIDQSSYLYLLTHSQLKLHKIGIGTPGKDKGQMAQLIDQGWVSHGLWHDSDKRKTFQWEKEIFKQLQLRFSKLAPDTPGFVGKSDRHWFEAVSAQAISLSELEQLISKIVRKKP
ncbi:MAG: hypothetical protein RL382_922 [Actinomycetota bacterium]|jgi:hypothetical protein